MRQFFELLIHWLRLLRHIVLDKAELDIVMPEREDFDVDNLPPLQASRDENREVTSLNAESGDQTASKAVPKAAQKGRSSVAIIALLLGLVALLGLGIIYYQQNQQLLDATSRIADLESRLSSTDESLTLNSVDIQVKLKEQKDRTDELWKQMDKLWASAWRRNQTEITDHTKLLAKHDELLAHASSELIKLDSLSSSLHDDVKSLKTDAKAMKKLIADVAEQKKTFTRIQRQFKDIQASQVSLQAISDDNAQWIKSINVFRKQTNQSLSRLEGKVTAQGTNNTSTAQ